ncbi:protoheme IX farnesyltransferase [delta proteobacterium NaphS2]|nr:protoheme IX farnesyltransferase [delta proteobacterium NaphS2]
MQHTIKNCLLVTKPGIVLGNLIPASAGFFLASKGHINVPLLLSTLTGISLVVASACVLNNCIDRNMDRKMARTRNRVMARGLISLKAAVSYAVLLGMAGIWLLLRATQPLCVAVVLSGFLIYVGVYSLHLKRRSVHATLVGSLAGVAPPLAGYCAVTGRLDTGALLLFLIFSLWQMPHCYAIAIFRRHDYAAARFPVVPVTQGIPAAKRHIVGYAAAFVAATLMLTFVGYTGYGYLAVAVVLGLVWLYMVWSGFRTGDDNRWARQLFAFSFMSMLVLSVMMSIDYTLPLDAALK